MWEEGGAVAGVSLAAYIFHMPSLARHMENAMNEVILAPTWFKSLLARLCGRVAYFKVFEELSRNQGFHLEW